MRITEPAFCHHPPMLRRTFAAALHYFACVFGAGLRARHGARAAAGAASGARWAELLEMPLMAVVIVAAALGRAPPCAAAAAPRCAWAQARARFVAAARRGSRPRDRVGSRASRGRLDRDPVPGHGVALMLPMPSCPGSCTGRTPRKATPDVELRPTYEHCNRALPPESTDARICSFRSRSARAASTSCSPTSAPTAAAVSAAPGAPGARVARWRLPRRAPGERGGQAPPRGPAAACATRRGAGRTAARTTLDPRSRNSTRRCPLPPVGSKTIGLSRAPFCNEPPSARR